MKKQLLFYFIFAISLFLFANKAMANTPIILSISPTSGDFNDKPEPDILYYQGDSGNSMVTIYGYNFMPKNSSCKLLINEKYYYYFIDIPYWYDNSAFHKPDTITFRSRLLGLGINSPNGYIQVVNPNGEISDKFEYTLFCIEDSYSCGEWLNCSINGQQTRVCNKKYNCEDSNLSPATNQSCIYIPACTLNDWSCADWGSCASGGSQTRTCNKTLNCQGGVSSPATSQSCSYISQCTSYSWSCGNWSSCSSSGSQTRTCNKILNCEGGAQSPATSQSCVYAPACSSDTWSCGSWGTCSPQGIQTRSCNKTFDCSSAETASPATSQYCVAPNQPQLQTPTESLGIVNQDSIVKATVKLFCPVSSTMASQGSGTVIDSKGMILTNKHVIDGTPGCLVGFINKYNDEPYFGDRQIADIYKISSDEDIAILKLRNPLNRSITFIDITKGNSSSLLLGNQMTTYGYPAKFGTKITYTSGDFSGVDGNYLKTTAIIEHGNSGGGAYLKNGTFIGIPSAVVKGSLNSMGLVLSINKINNWLSNSPLAYDSGSFNNYSRVSSVLENINLSTLGSLNLFIAGNSDLIVDLTSYGVTQKTISGSLVKIKDSTAVYLTRDGKRYSFPNQKTYESWYGKDFSAVTTITAETLASYQLVGNINYKPGSLVKIPTVPKVYLVTDNGGLRWLTTEEKLTSLGFSFSQVQDLPEVFFTSYTVGTDI